MKAIVSRLQSIEEMAGIDILCSDKTGTLTQNQLTLGEPEVFAAAGNAQELILAASLASKEENRDAIDQAIAGQAGGTTAKAGSRTISRTKFIPL